MLTLLDHQAQEVSMQIKQFRCQDNYLPTGIVVTSSEKSQHQNRANYMTALKSRLYELEMRKRNESIQESHNQKGEAGWGNQIRSYVLHPYQMVKD